MSSVTAKTLARATGELVARSSGAIRKLDFGKFWPARARPGFQTAAMLFGNGFAESIDETAIIDL